MSDTITKQKNFFVVIRDLSLGASVVKNRDWYVTWYLLFAHMGTFDIFGACWYA